MPVRPEDDVVTVREKDWLSAPEAVAVTVKVPWMLPAIRVGLVAEPFAIVHVAESSSFEVVQPASVPKVACAPVFGTTVKVTLPALTGSLCGLVRETTSGAAKAVAESVVWELPLVLVREKS